MQLGEVCDLCELTCTEEALGGLGGKPMGVDPCLGVLPGVMFACCGHGKNVGYITFEAREDGLHTYIKFDTLEIILDTVEGRYFKLQSRVYKKKEFSNDSRT